MLNKYSLEKIKFKKNLFNTNSNNMIFKDVKEFNIILLILIGLFLISISGYSSYAIFSDEIVSNNEIKGIIKVKNLDKSGANAPLLTSNMVPVYYDESDNNWHKADSSNSNSKYQWYNYDSKMWANAVTLHSNGSYKSKVIPNIIERIGSPSCSADIVDINDRPVTEVTTDYINEVNIDYDNGIFYTSYDGEPRGTNIPLQNIYLIDSSTYNLKCGFDYENNTIGDLQSLEEDGGGVIVDIMNDYLEAYGFLILRFFDNATGESAIYYFDDSSTVVEETGPYRISPVYTIRENITSTNHIMGSGFSFNEKLGEYTLSDTSNSALNSSAVGKYICQDDTRTCTIMYKINTVSNGIVTNVDMYRPEMVQANELTLVDGSKMACLDSVCTREDYINAPNGTVIPMSDINAMFVWIPRYKYTYFASNTPTSIPITFEKGEESTGTIKCTDAISASIGKSEVCTDTTNGSLVTGTSTYTHPSFTFGDKELTGIWVGKFENSGGNTIAIKPDDPATVALNISTIFKNTRNMELANNIYGFPQTGTTLNTYTGEISGDSNNLDTHMMKNMEWGAVAYLSHSKYGMNGEVYINNSGTMTVNGVELIGYYTGRSGGNVGGVTYIKNTYTDQTSTSQSNQYGFYTYDGYLLNYNTNVKSSKRDLNKVASTTGNIYGIYDMSGGTSECVMGNMQDSSNAFYPSDSETWSATNKPLDKYYDKYSYETSTTQYTRGKLGDATIEMKPNPEETYSWYNDTAWFVYADKYAANVWFTRGESAAATLSAGLFAHFINDGRCATNSSRTVLSITP